MKVLFDRPFVLGQGEKYVAVDGESIAYIGEARPEGEFERVISCRDKLMIPGLYNCHSHAAMTLFRGYGEDMPLDRWLNERIFPAEDRLTNESVYVASKLAIAEMIKNGIVSFSDMYFFCDMTARAVKETGIKANLSRCIVSFDDDWEKNERIDEAKKLFRECHNTCGGRLRIDLSLHAEYTNTAIVSNRVAKIAKELGASVQLHLSETEKEHRECIARNGKTPTAFFRDCGVLDSPVTAAHCVWVDNDDMDILAKYGVSVAHNPVSNLKLGSGVMPLSQMLGRGINVTLGTDGTASNNTLDILKEMYICAILHKGVSRDPEITRVNDIIKMATANGAAAQGREKCGIIERGYRADIVLVDMNAINNIPVYDMSYGLLYSANSSNVCMTMIDGAILYENGEFTSIDIEKLKADMRETCENYFKD